MRQLCYLAAAVLVLAGLAIGGRRAYTRAEAENVPGRVVDVRETSELCDASESLRFCTRYTEIVEYERDGVRQRTEVHGGTSHDIIDPHAVGDQVSVLIDGNEVWIDNARSLWRLPLSLLILAAVAVATGARTPR